MSGLRVTRLYKTDAPGSLVERRLGDEYDGCMELGELAKAAPELDLSDFFGGSSG